MHENPQKLTHKSDLPKTAKYLSDSAIKLYSAPNTRLDLDKVPLMVTKCDGVIDLIKSAILDTVL